MRGSESIAGAFAKVLRKARVEAGLTQEELAHLSGLDRSTISQAELANASPQMETLIRLAGALEMDPCDLMPAVRWEPPAAATSPRGTFLRQKPQAASSSGDS
jgi:transcriptional regulator with XRE-family HTH domain